MGDHGCEYMTGGVAVVLGRTGRNFAAGMSGGIAYVYDEDGDFEVRCNTSMVDLEPIRREGAGVMPGTDAAGGADYHPDKTRFDEPRLRGLIERHLHYTGSDVARRMLDDWENRVERFVKIMPVDYRRALEEMRREEESGLALVEAAL